MERRTFLKGAVVAAPTPAAVFAPALVATIAGLIASYRDVGAELTKLNAQVDEIWERPDRPPMPVVRRSEVGMPYVLRINRNDIHLRATLVEVFDYEDSLVEHNKTSFGMPEAYGAKIKERTERDRKRVLALWDERQALHDAWATASGYNDVNREIERLYDVETKLDDQIINWRCETLEEVRLKAAHLDSVYQGRMPAAISAAVIKSLIA